MALLHGHVRICNKHKSGDDGDFRLISTNKRYLHLYLSSPSLWDVFAVKTKIIINHILIIIAIKNIKPQSIFTSYFFLSLPVPLQSTLRFPNLPCLSFIIGVSFDQLEHGALMTQSSLPISKEKWFRGEKVNAIQPSYYASNMDREKMGEPSPRFRVRLPPPCRVQQGDCSVLCALPPGGGHIRAGINTNTPCFSAAPAGWGCCALRGTAPPAGSSWARCSAALFSYKKINKM